MPEFRTSLAGVAIEKKKIRDQLIDLSSRYLGIIYGGVVRKDNFMEIRKQLIKETLNQKKNGEAYSHQMLAIAVREAKRFKDQTKSVEKIEKEVEAKYGYLGDATIALGVFAYDLIKSRNVELKMSKAVTNNANTFEGKRKEEIINSIVTENFNQAKFELNKDESDIDTSKIKIFYLASTHKDSAKDHKDYQGKMYIDANWKDIKMPYALENAISYYVKSHNIRTFQWVTGRPVWFITRPNCRHYFKELSVKEVLGYSKRKLTNKYDLKRAIGDRQYVQTINHSTNKKWYMEARNAQLLLKSYKDRLRLHQILAKESLNPIIKDAISKDKLLIEKWEDYLKKKGALE